MKCPFAGCFLRVPADMPLYDILNEFQKGSSHMAAVVKPKGRNKNAPQVMDGKITEENKITGADSQLTTPLLSKQDEKLESIVVDIEKASRPTIINRQSQHSDAATNGLPRLSEDIEDGEVIGIITLEDVFEELLQVIHSPLMSHFHFFEFLLFLIVNHTVIIFFTYAGGDRR